MVAPVTEIVALGLDGPEGEIWKVSLGSGLTGLMASSECGRLVDATSSDSALYPRELRPRWCSQVKV